MRRKLPINFVALLRHVNPSATNVYLMLSGNLHPCSIKLRIRNLLKRFQVLKNYLNNEDYC